MKIELKLMEKGKSDLPIGVLPPRPESKKASLIFWGDKDIVEDVKRLIESADKWDII